MKLKAVTIAYLHSLSQRNALGSAHKWFSTEKYDQRRQISV
jgi:hypothetical protein